MQFPYFQLSQGGACDLRESGFSQPTLFPGFSPTRTLSLCRAGCREPWEQGC